ncbi:MAG: polyketide synthase dehydratase domain-containing protein [Candidatus Entotheonellia bacterium]
MIFHRGRCMDLASSAGKMLAVGCSPAEAERAMQGYEDRVSLAAINSPASATLSGDPQALEEISQACNAAGMFCRFLPVNYAFHSQHTEPVRAELLASLDGLDLQPTLLPMLSTVTGEPVEGRQLDKHYWWRNVREGVRFADAVDRLITSDYEAFVELSPHPVLSAAVSECLSHRGRQGTALPSLRRQDGERATMLASLGALYTLGYSVDWRIFWPGGGRPVHLPAYPWQRERYWHELEELRELRIGKHAHPLLGRHLRSADPTWESVLDTRSLKYLGEHRLHEHAVFPASAYVEMALGAAQESLAGGGCILEEIQFQQALFLPDNDAPSTVQLALYPADGAFAIRSRPPQANQPWILHTVGSLRRQPDLDPPAKVDLDAVRKRLGEEMPAEDCYGAFAALGLHYGQAFRGIERLWRTDGEALGQVSLCESPALDYQRYCFHPAFLDACFQVVSGALPRDHMAMTRTLYLPVQIERVRLYRRAEHQVWSHVHLTHLSAHGLACDIRVYDEDGSLLLEVEGFRCQALRGGQHAERDDMQHWFYEMTWQSKPRPEQGLGRRSANFIPVSREIVQPMLDDVRRLAAESDWAMQVSRARAQSKRLPYAYVAQAFHELDWPYQPGEYVTVASLMQQLNLAPRHQRLIGRLLWVLEAAGDLSRAGTGTWLVERVPVAQDPGQLWQQALADNPAFVTELTLMDRCGSHLGAALRGEQDVLQLLFPEGSTATAEHLYQDSPTFRLYNTMVQRAVSRALHGLPAGRSVRILEVGAGTGGLTEYVLPVLPGDRTEYVFSDVTPLFLAKAEQKLCGYPFLRFQLLDIEKDPLQQGYEPHGFDLILASDVLHATGDLREALRHLQTLLSSDGLLILLEGERVPEPTWIDLVFGLTEGWWKFRDLDLRPDYPLMTRQAWQAVLEEVGFQDVVTSSVFPGEGEAIQVVMLARNPHLNRTTRHWHTLTGDPERSLRRTGWCSGST